MLNNIGVVRGSARTRVLKAVEKLKDYPNIHARALAGGASKALGLIVSNVDNRFSPDIFRGLDDEAHSRSLERLMANTGYAPGRLARIVHLMMFGRRVARQLDRSGFDNIRLSAFLNPALTTVHVPREQIRRRIFENLTGPETAGESPREVVIDPELVVRESTGNAHPLEGFPCSGFSSCRSVRDSP